MRILFIVQNYPPERGPVNYTRDAAVDLARRGHIVTVLTGVPHYPFGSPYPGFRAAWPCVRIEDGVRVVRTPLILASNRQTIRRLIGFLSFIISALPWVIFLKRADVVVASVPPVTVAFIGLMVSFVHRRPMVAILRDVEPLDSFAARGVRLVGLWKMVANLCMWVYRRANRVVVIHNDQISSLIKYGVEASSICVIPHSIELDTFHAATAVDAAKLPRKTGRHLAVYLGTIGVSHDLQSFLEALADSQVRDLPFDVVVVGEGECMRECARLTQTLQLGNVSFRPPVSHDQVPAILSQADLLVASFRNGLNPVISSKIYEYCAAGRPVIVFGDCDAGQLVTHIGNGWECPNRTSEELYSALAEYAADTQAGRRMGALGREYAEQHFDRNASREQWDRLIQAFAGS